MSGTSGKKRGPSKTGRGQGRSPIHPSRVSVARRQTEALELRAAGWTLDEIAEKLGYSTATLARRAVLAALKRAGAAPASEYRKVERARLERIIKSIWPKCVGREPGTRGPADPGEPPDLESIDRLVKLMQRRAALDGLDAPKRTQIGGDPNSPPVQIDGTTTARIDLSRIPDELLKQLIVYARPEGHAGILMDAPLDLELLPAPATPQPEIEVENGLENHPAGAPDEGLDGGGN